MNQNNQNKPLFYEKRTDALITAAAAHPYLIAFALCIFLHPFYLGAAENVPNNALLIVALLIFAAGTALIFRRVKLGGLDKRIAALAVALLGLADIAGSWLYSRSQIKGVIIFCAGVLTLFAFYSSCRTKKYKEQLNSLLIMGIGFILKFYYVFYTSVYTRQNDVHTFGGEDGHAAYMEYLLYNHKLPDFDVREVWQFCHPPLHHMISAVWIFINENIFCIGHNPARESLQTLTLFYSTAIMITAYKLLRHFKLKGFSLYIPLLIINFHPSFILLSGSINNDVLSVAFMLGALLCTLKWYEDQTMGGIVKIALCIGLGMMTKLSAALVAPPVAIVFLIVLIKKCRTDFAKLAGQFSVFAVICVPLGLWFEIKNFIKYRVPITYVQEMSEDVFQYIGDMSFKSRVTDFSPKQFESVFECWARKDERGVVNGYNEYNPLVALLKNSLFGESINEGYFAPNSPALSLCRVFFWLGAGIAAVFLILTIISLINKSRTVPLDMGGKLLLGSFYIVMIANFYKMSYDYPFTCTMNFRYITPTVIVTSLFCGIFLEEIKPKGRLGSAAASVLSVTVVGFAFLSTYIYLTVCCPSGM